MAGIRAELSLLTNGVVRRRDGCLGRRTIRVGMVAASGSGRATLLFGGGGVSERLFADDRGGDDALELIVNRHLLGDLGVFLEPREELTRAMLAGAPEELVARRRSSIAPMFRPGRTGTVTRRIGVLRML